MAVMLNVTEPADGFLFTPTLSSQFTLYNQTLALTVPQVFSGLLIALYLLARTYVLSCFLQKLS